MIKLIKLSAKGFMSFKSLELDFKKGLYLIDGYNYDENTSNGSGKSAIVDAICYSLYGDIPRKVKADEIVNWDSDSLDIQITFDKNGKTCFIHRTRNPNVLSFYVDTVLKNGTDARETQLLINDFIGVGFNTFLQSIYFSQVSIVSQFLFSNDEERKDVLTELLDLYIFDECLEKVKIDNKKMAEKMVLLEKELTVLNKEEASLVDEVKHISVLADNFESSRKEELQAIRHKIFELEDDKRKADDKYKEDCALVSVVEKSNARIKELKAQIDEGLDTILSGYQTKLATSKSDIRHLNKRLEEFNELIQQGKCPTCLQPITQECLRGSIDPIAVDLEEALKEKESIKDALEKVELAIKEREPKKKEVNDLNIKILSLNQTIKNSTTNYDIIVSNLKKFIDEQQIRLEKKRDEKNEYIGLVESKNLKIKQIVDEYNAKKIALGKAEGVMAAYNILVKAFGREGIKAFVFTKVVNELNHHIAQYLKQMFDGNVNLRFDIQSLNSQGVTKQKMDVILTINGERRNLHLLSGGERARLMLATNFALSKIISNRSAFIPNFVCLDECFTGLDNAGKEKIMEFLRKISETKDFVYVIDHQTEFQSAFDGVYKVEKRDGVSQII